MHHHRPDAARPLITARAHDTGRPVAEHPGAVWVADPITHDDLAANSADPDDLAPGDRRFADDLADIAPEDHVGRAALLDAYLMSDAAHAAQVEAHRLAADHARAQRAADRARRQAESDGAASTAEVNSGGMAVDKPRSPKEPVAPVVRFIL